MKESDSIDARHGAGPDTVAVVVVVVGEAVLVVVVVALALLGGLVAAVAGVALVACVLALPPELPHAARSSASERGTSTETSALLMFRCSSIA